MAKVYLSSTGDDLREYREAAREVLKRQGHLMLSHDPLRVIDGDLKASLDQIAAADLLVMIVSRRDGKFAEAEYARAKEANKPLLVFMLGDEPRGSVEEPDQPPSSFVRRLTNAGVSILRISSVSDFATKLEGAVTQWDTNRAKPPSIDITLDDLPLMWRLVVGSFADPELLRHLDPSAFVAAIKKWEEANSADPAAPWPSRLERARKALDSAQTEHEASAFWIAWMRATRPAKTTAAEPPESGHAM